MEVKYVNWGLANNFGTHIELNKNLKDYPHLHENILKHELNHSDKFFTLDDLKQDITPIMLNQLELIKFFFKYPRSLIQFLPFYWTIKKGFVYDINLIFIYLFIGVLIFGSIFLGLYF